MTLLFSTLPRPLQEEVDLMVSKKTWTTAKQYLFPIHKPSAIEVKDNLELDKDACDQYIDKVAMRNTYETLVRPALLTRCLISPHAVTDPKGVQLHNKYYLIISHHPRYMTSLELMENLNYMPASNRNSFLDHLSDDREIIIEDWENKFGASVGTTVDHMSLLDSKFDNDSLILKGECDASYCEKTKTAQLSIVIWRHDTIFSCIIVEVFWLQQFN